jgi:hypothetical protein
VLRIKRLVILEPLKGYFQGNMAANQLGQRARELTNRGFMQSTEFHSLAVIAYQRAIDAKRKRTWEARLVIIGFGQTQKCRRFDWL